MWEKLGQPSERESLFREWDSTYPKHLWGGNLEPKVIVEGVGKNGADTNYSRKPREELG